MTELVRAVAPLANLAVEVAQVRTDPAHLGRLMDAGGGPAVLVVDHFEGPFATATPTDLPPYVDALLGLRTGGRHLVLLTFRSDGLPEMGSYAGLVEAINHGRVLLMFTNRELRQVIAE